MMASRLEDQLQSHQHKLAGHPSCSAALLLCCCAALKEKSLQQLHCEVDDHEWR
jgi:hypothetical protein